MKCKYILLQLFTMLLVISCKKNNVLEQSYLESETYSYDFSTNIDKWQGGFSDYPKLDEAIYELDFQYSHLPYPLDSAKGAIKQSGNNHSDDLFMFIKRKLNGLKPNQEYLLKFSVEFATDASDNSFGVGGSPGSSVYLKAGASLNEPSSIIEGDYYRMNIDKSNQANDGKDMVVIGDFSNGLNEAVYNLKTVNNDTQFEIASDNNGSIWIIIGTDSGFESTTTIYYNKIVVELKMSEQ